MVISVPILRKADLTVTVTAGAIISLISLSGKELSNVVRYLSLETIYVLLGMVLSSYSVWQTKSRDTSNLYDYFSVNLTGIVFGLFIVTAVPDDFELVKLKELVPVSVTTTLASLYYNMKLFLGPLFLIKYVPTTSVGNNIIVFVALVSAASAIVYTIPMIVNFIDKSSNIRMAVLFFGTHTIIQGYAKNSNVKELLLLSTPLLTVPMFGSFVSG
jgi:hypothetical protein